MPNETVNTIEVRQGESVTLTYTARDADGDTIALDNDTGMAAIIRDYPGGTARSVTFAEDPAGDASGVITLEIADDELDDLAPGEYTLAFTSSYTDTGVTYTRVVPLSGSLLLRVLPRA